MKKKKEGRSPQIRAKYKSMLKFAYMLVLVFALQIVSGHVFADQTYSEYLFEEASGDTVKDSQGSNDGIIMNDVTRGEGIVGNGLTFTGAGYVAMVNSLGNIQSAVTMSAWLKPMPVNGNYQGVIMHGGPNTDTYAFYINPDAKLIGFKTTGTSSETEWASIEGVNVLFDGEWHLVTLTYDGSQKSIYVDDELLQSFPATGSIESGEGYNLLLGAGRDEDTPTLLYEGLMDEARIYDYALTDSEVKNLYDLVFTSLQDIDKLEGDVFTLFPNPASTYINVNYLNQLTINTRISIIDCTGKTFLSKPIKSATNRIDISQFPKGLYFIKSDNQQNSFVKKLLVK